MTPKYIFVIDESGDAGVENVRDGDKRGASPYMTLGACLVPLHRADHLKSQLRKISDHMGRTFLHCNKLNHAQKTYYSRTIGREKILCFGVVSMKATLGSYQQAIESDSSKYYNKCAQYLLEKLGLFMQLNNVAPSDVEIVFEEGNFNYSALISLILKCQANPHQPQTKLLSHIDAFKIRKKPKGDEPLLQLADLVAHALFSCVNRSDSNLHIPEVRYARELEARFFSDPDTGRVEGWGVKAIHSMKDLKLDDDVAQFIDQLGAVDC